MAIGHVEGQRGVRAIHAGIELERRLENLYTPHKTKMGVSGCPRNCAEATVKDIGLVGQEGRWQVAALHAAMLDVVRRAPEEHKLAFLCGHPELAGREAQTGTMTAESTGEQSSAGLHALTGAERNELQPRLP